MKTKQKHLQNAGEEEGPGGDGRAAAAVEEGETEASSDEFGGPVGTCWL